MNLPEWNEVSVPLTPVDFKPTGFVNTLQSNGSNIGKLTWRIYKINKKRFHPLVTHWKKIIPPK